ncbi:MAG: hypothetical protein HY010_13370 [Acidobacteria bacterium]|nr:hypothetical protein [Acidobacteriota bacterium]
MSETLWQSRFQLLRQLGIAALVGLFIALPCIFVTNQAVFAGLLVAAMLLVLPGMVYLVLVTMWHWKQRYRGSHSDLWGGLILLETSGWFKLVYLFRHIIPDARGIGRYSQTNRGIENRQ